MMRNAYYLNCHSHFSLRYGTMSAEKLVELAVQHQIESLALTDIQSMSACFDFVRACRKAGIAPVVGMEFRQEGELLYILLARNLEGFAEINAWYSQFSLNKKTFPELPAFFNQVYVVYPWARKDLVSLSEHEFLGVRADQVNQLYRSRYRYRTDKLLALQTISFSHKREHNLHRLLRAIDQNVLLSHLSKQAQASTHEMFMQPEDLRNAFQAYPSLLTNTSRLLSQCSFDFEMNQDRTRQTFSGDHYNDMLLLEKLAQEGLEKRYGSVNKKAQERLQHELQIIDQLGFNAYFLITWDFVRYGQQRGFFHVGRGSGANSIAAYCLGITDVDPIELDLYFERFLNPKRTSPPDFDIDFSWKDRDGVIDYVFKRYRESHVALLASYNCFRGKASIRELGKVFGLPKREIDLLVMNRNMPSKGLDKQSRQVLYYARMLDGMPNHLSIHAGGVLISEEPIYTCTPKDMPPKGFPITHFDMHVAEDIGLHKFDILSQRGLAHIRECVEIVQVNQGKHIDIHQVDTFKQDALVNQKLAQGDTVGCFYIESPAMRGLLSKLRCNDYLTLVAASSVIRPGVARSGMMQTYIERHNGRLFAYPHPKLGELLDETYGVMVYQEDVIKVVHGFAGLSLAEADMLRRAMSGKSRGSDAFAAVSEKYFAACREKGYPEAIVKELWRQIESFAGYSFSKAHSASFAVESYQSLYLKTHYPLEFITAVINNFGGFYDTEIYVHEARMSGATVHAPCVNHSTYLTRLIGQDIYLGFVHLKDLQQKIAQNIATERQRRGPYKDLADFARRIPLSQEQITILIRIGAFRFTNKSKPHLLWELHLQVKPHNEKEQADILFDFKTEEAVLPEFSLSPLEDAYDEMELLGFPLLSPFEMLQTTPPNCITVQQFPNHVNQMVQILGYMICVKTTSTIHKEAHAVRQLL